MCAITNKTEYTVRSYAAGPSYLDEITKEFWEMQNNAKQCTNSKEGWKAIYAKQC